MAEDQLQQKLIDEINESESTPEQVRAETIRILEEADKLLEFADSQWLDENQEIRQEYEDIRLKIVQELTWDVTLDRENFKQMINDDLSNWEITNSELWGIKDSFLSFYQNHRELNPENSDIMIELNDAMDNSYHEIDELIFEHEIIIDWNEVTSPDDLIKLYRNSPEDTEKLLRESEIPDWEIVEIIKALDTFIKNKDKLFKEIIEKNEEIVENLDQQLEGFREKYSIKESIDEIQDLYNKNPLNVEDFIFSEYGIKEEDKQKILSILEIRKESMWYIENINYENDYHEESKQIYIKEKEIKETLAQTASSRGITKDNIWTQFLDEQDWNYYVSLWDWEEKFEITQEEYETVKNSPEALNNLINMREVLIELNLKFIWDNRIDFYNASTEWKWFWFINPRDKDLVNEEELRKFLDFILETLWYDENYSNIWWYIAKLRKISWSWLDQEKTDFMWNSPIELIYKEVWYLEEDSQLTSKIRFEYLKTWKKDGINLRGKARQIIEWKEEV